MQLLQKMSGVLKCVQGKKQHKCVSSSKWMFKNEQETQFLVPLMSNPFLMVVLAET